MSDDKKLFLLDGMALIYRAFFAFNQNPRITSFGLNTNAPYGFTNTLLDILNREKPTHIAVVFDTDKPTPRHIEYTEYKANREAMPEDLSRSVPYIFKIIEAFNIPVITLDGYEADDIIGTLAKQAEKKGYTTYMMTPDKDFGQLVSKNIYMYKPGRQGKEFEVLGVPEVLAKWGGIENVDQVVDILGLMGDAVDNIPGIQGVGEKTAIKLVKQFGSVENLVANTDQLKGKQKEKVEEQSDMALLSKKLARIIIDVPIELDEKGLVKEEPNKEALQEIFTELEFRTMAKRVFGEEVQDEKASQQSLFGGDNKPTQNAAQTIHNEGAYKTAATTPHTYKLITSKEERTALIKQLETAKEWCFDTETTSLNAIDAEIVGMSFSLKPHEAYYVPVSKEKEEAIAVLNEFKPVFESDNSTKIGQNIKYDLLVLQNYDIQLQGALFDTMLTHYLLEPDKRHNMDALAESYLNYKTISIETLIGKKGKNQLSMRDVEVEKVAEYAAEDADITLRLKEILEPQLDDKNARYVLEKVESPLIKVLADMEREGVRIDKEMLANYSKVIETDVQQLEKDIYSLAGVEFNIASPKQLGEVLFDKLELDAKAKKTKTGQYKTDEEVLTNLAREHEIAQKIIDFRQLQKLKSTYVDALPQLINDRTGRVHTSFNQAVAATGRLSSTDPNLQNIPIRTDRGREVRKAFIPRDENHVLLSADYSQIELRIVAAISNDRGMIEDFKKGLDIHTATAAKVFGVSLDDVDRDMRRKAKMVNFGIIYGISAFGLSQRLEIPRKEAASIIESYFIQYPDIKRYMNDTIESAKEKGYVETLLGRRRYLRDINSSNHTVRGFAERNAINAPIQGSAADMIKLAMISIHKQLKEQELQSKMILQVHDELLFDVHKPELETLKPIIKKEMMGAMDLEVPLEVEMGVGQNWLEAH